MAIVGSIENTLVGRSDMFNQHSVLIQEITYDGRSFRFQKHLKNQSINIYVIQYMFSTPEHRYIII
jgi:hypothetical protein